MRRSQLTHGLRLRSPPETPWCENVVRKKLSPSYQNQPLALQALARWTRRSRVPPRPLAIFHNMNSAETAPAGASGGCAGAGFFISADTVHLLDQPQSSESQGLILRYDCAACRYKTFERCWPTYFGRKVRRKRPGPDSLPGVGVRSYCKGDFQARDSHKLGQSWLRAWLARSASNVGCRASPGFPPPGTRALLNPGVFRPIPQDLEVALEVPDLLWVD